MSIIVNNSSTNKKPQYLSIQLNNYSFLDCFNIEAISDYENCYDSYADIGIGNIPIDWAVEWGMTFSISDLWNNFETNPLFQDIFNEYNIQTKDINYILVHSTVNSLTTSAKSFAYLQPGYDENDIFEGIFGDGHVMLTQPSEVIHYNFSEFQEFWYDEITTNGNETLSITILLK